MTVAFTQTNAELRTEARRKAFALLAIVALLRSLAPGAVNYWQAQHILSSDPADKSWTHLATLTSMGTSLLLAATCARILLHFHLAGAWLSRTTLLFLATLLLGFARTHDVMALGWRGYLDLASLIALVLSAVALEPRLEDMRVFGVLGVAVAVYSLLFSVLMPSHAFMIDPLGPSGLPAKAIVGHQLLAGPTSHSNTLGILLTLCVPWTMLFKRRCNRLGALSILVFTVVFTASRTSLIALALSLAIICLCSSRTRLWSKVARAAALAGSFVMCACLPFLSRSDYSFSGRGGVWRRSLAAWHSQGSPLVGVGPYWSPNSDAVDDPGLVAMTSSGHNVGIQWLVTGGPLLLALGGLLFMSLAYRAAQLDAGARSPIRTAYLVGLFVISTTEFILVPELSSQLALPAILMLAAIAAPPRTEAAYVEQRRHAGTRYGHRVATSRGTGAMAWITPAVAAVPHSDRRDW